MIWFKALIPTLQLLTASFLPEADTVKMLFLGDLMQHKEQLESAYTGRGKRDNPSSYSYSNYFKHLNTFFLSSDIVAINMETTFGAPPYSGYPVFCSPSSLAEECAAQGVNLFFAANNHSADKGSKGIVQGIELYKRLGVNYAGIYLNREDELSGYPVVIEKRGVRVAFLNYTYGTNGIVVKEPLIVKYLVKKEVEADIQRAASFNPHIIVACVHWGDEYKLEPSAAQLDWERFLYAKGVNIIIGAHPHVPQEIKVYYSILGEIKGITAYSLGNAISNMTAKNTRIGVMLEINLVKGADGRVTILEPAAHPIWTSRPSSTKGYYTIIPVKQYLKNPKHFGIDGEEWLIRSYYNKFFKNDR